MNIEDVLTSSYFESREELSSWLPYLESEFSRPYICHLRCFLWLERNASDAMEEPNRDVFYPKAKKVFAALEKTPLCNVKAVIVGQDPYHNGQADGLAFSRRTSSQRSFHLSSLYKIFKAVNRDLNIEIPLNGTVHSLRPWAEQGVLLLNTILSVRRGCPKSHYCQGWEKLTDRIIEVVSQNRRNVAFFLWGKEAKCKRAMIDNSGDHAVFCSDHPRSSKPFATEHFSGANQYLSQHGLGEIDWSLVS